MFFLKQWPSVLGGQYSRGLPSQVCHTLKLAKQTKKHFIIIHKNKQLLCYVQRITCIIFSITKCIFMQWPLLDANGWNINVKICVLSCIPPAIALSVVPVLYTPVAWWLTVLWRMIYRLGICIYLFLIQTHSSPTSMWEKVIGWQTFWTTFVLPPKT